MVATTIAASPHALTTPTAAVLKVKKTSHIKTVGVHERESKHKHEQNALTTGIWLTYSSKTTLYSWILLALRLPSRYTPAWILPLSAISKAWHRTLSLSACVIAGRL